MSAGVTAVLRFSGVEWYFEDANPRGRTPRTGVQTPTHQSYAAISSRSGAVATLGNSVNLRNFGSVDVLKQRETPPRYRCVSHGSQGCSRPRIVEKPTDLKRPVSAPGHLLPREEAQCGSPDPRRWHGVRVCKTTGRRPRRRARAPPPSTSPAAPTGRSPDTGRGSSRAPDHARSGRLRSSDRTHPRPRRRGRH